MGQSKKWPRWFAVIKKRQTKCLCKSVYSFSNYSKKMRNRCVHQIRSDKTDCSAFCLAAPTHCHGSGFDVIVVWSCEWHKTLRNPTREPRLRRICTNLTWITFSKYPQMWFEFHLQKLHFLNQAGYYLGIAKKEKTNWACNQTKQLNNLKMLGCRISSWTANANC